MGMYTEDVRGAVARYIVGFHVQGTKESGRP